MISLRALNGTGVGGHDDFLDGSGMISFGALDSAGGQGKVSCLDE